MSSKLTVGIVFGGKSVEHEVSVLTGFQIIRALNHAEKYDVVPVYISKTGEWSTGEKLLNIGSYKYIDHGVIPGESCILPADSSIKGLISPIKAGLFQKSKVVPLDVVIPAVHGTNGEDGTLQGLFELANIPYTGCDVVASSIGMNKALTKKVLKFEKLPFAEALEISQIDWETNPQKIKEEILARFECPYFVKPCNLGSSIGVKKISNIDELDDALALVFTFDNTALVEMNLGDFQEINCAVLGDGNNIQASPCEQPIPWQEFLTYEDKYLRGNSKEGMAGAQRIIPAPLTQALSEKIQQTAIQAFRAIRGSGIARIDFFVNPDNEKIYINEINTTPGSFAFYLWEAASISPDQVLDRLIQIAMDVHKRKQKRIFSNNTGLLEKVANSGIKFGTKNIG